MHDFLTSVVTLAMVAPLVVNGNEARIEGFARVTDGDTLSFGPVIVRLHGIDAPEAGQTCSDGARRDWQCGTEATNRLAEMVENYIVSCIPLERDVYGRIVSRCTADGLDLSATLTEEGLAWAFVRYSDDYVGVEAAAREAGVGVWETSNQPPWEYREARWERAAAASPRDGCPIKGNISRSGERIYHTPWSPHYERTKIDEENGEQWFCDEAEAIAAGWRSARWR